jgi:branched-subunit amino acid transport protein AzlD
MTDFIYSIGPESSCLLGLLMMFCLTLTIAAKPAWGCGGIVAIIVVTFLFLTTNGLVAIFGGVVVAIVFIFVKFGGSGMNVNIESIGDGNSITIGGK